MVGRRRGAVVVGLVAAILASCETPADVHDHTGPEVGSPSYQGVVASEFPALAKDVHAATAKYHSRAQATKAGYAQASECVAAPGLGGMGFHWVRDDLVDPVFEPLKPEAILYAPGPAGMLHLVAVEYIVIDVGQPAPTFDGVPFDVGGTPVPVDHWSLHLWIHKQNPNGVFTRFNPAVTCPS